MMMVEMTLFITVCIISSVIVLISILLKKKGFDAFSSSSIQQSKTTTVNNVTLQKSKQSHPSSKLKKSQSRGIISKEKATQHPLYLSTLKGFTRSITCVAINSTATKILVSSSDSSIRVFSIDAESPSLSLEKQIYIRGIINADYFTAIDFSIDDAYLFGATALHRVFHSELSCKLVKLAQTTSGVKTSIFEQIAESESSIHKNSVRWLSASKGRWIVTASENDDTEIKIFNYSLNLLSSFDTRQIKNFHLGFSPINGGYFGVAAWSPGVKVMKIQSQKDGDYKKLEKAMDLGTPCGVNAVAFSTDNTKAVLACKDGTLMLWNINVRYQANEDAKKILSIKEELTPDHKGYSQLQFSSDGLLIVGVSNKSIRFLSTINLSLIETLEDAHTMPIRSLSVSTTGRFFVTGALDSRPRVWRLPSTPL